jgi:hypothetical protein
MLLRVLLALMALVPAGASAQPKVAVFPFDLVFQQSEEDFFYGAPKATPEELLRLKLVRDELTGRLSNSGKFEMLDISSVAADIDAAAPLYNCNGCEMDFAKKLGADLIYLGLIEKASATLLSMKVIVVDVAEGKPLHDYTAVIRGNTDDAWLNGMKWLAKNRLLAEEGAKP